MRSITINSNDAGQRLDKFLTKVLVNMPYSLLYKYIRKKRIKIGGKKAAIAYKLIEGDILELYLNDEFFDRPDPRVAYERVKPSLDIVYEDQNIIVVDKKPGMVVHEDDQGTVNTLIANIQKYLFDKSEYIPENENSFAPALCNRIDRNTGGMVIAAKNAPTLRMINAKIKGKELKKFYLCIAQGKFSRKSDELKGYLLKDSTQNKVFIYDSPQQGALSVITRYKVLAEKENMSLLEVELVTGRTHQIRAHLASIGHPLAGDGKYGTNAFNKSIGLKQQALYAYKLIFDFTSSADHLDYLKGKVLEVNSVDFAKKFTAT